MTCSKIVRSRGQPIPADHQGLRELLRSKGGEKFQPSREAASANRGSIGPPPHKAGRLQTGHIGVLFPRAAEFDSPSPTAHPRRHGRLLRVGRTARHGHAKRGTDADRLYRVPLPRIGGAFTEDAGAMLRSGGSWSRSAGRPEALCADTDAKAGVIARPVRGCCVAVERRRRGLCASPRPTGATCRLGLQARLCVARVHLTRLTSTASSEMSKYVTASC